MPGPIQNSPGTFRQISEQFSGLDKSLDGKHLRVDDANPDKGVYLHGSGSLLDTRVQQKHERAFETVAQAITDHINQSGAGKLDPEIGHQVLRDVLGERYDGRQISVGDMKRVIEHVQALDRAKVGELVDSFAGQLEGTDIDVGELREKLMQAPMPDGFNLDMLGKLVKAQGDWEGSPARGLDTLRQDLESANPWQALAGHGLIKDRALFAIPDFGQRHVGLAGTGKPEDISFDRLRERTVDVMAPQPDGKTKIQYVSGIHTDHGKFYHEETRASGSFLHFTSDTHRHGEENGNKLHISVRREDTARAWGTIAPILLKNPDVGKHFKVVDIVDANRKLEELDRKIAELENAPAGPKRDRDLTDARISRDSVLRVLEGTQITLYDEKPGVAPKRFQEVLSEISEALRRDGIAPGKQPGSDLPVDEFVSYRNDRMLDPETGRLDYIDESSPKYGEHFEKMKESPFFVTLVNPQSMGIVESIKESGKGIGKDQTIYGRTHGKGGIVLHNDYLSGSVGIMQSSSGRAIRHVALTRANEEINRMLDRFERGLDSLGGNPNARETVDALRRELEAGPKNGEWLANAVHRLTAALGKDGLLDQAYARDGVLVRSPELLGIPRREL
jgi:hypothetical protein